MSVVFPDHTHLLFLNPLEKLFLLTVLRRYFFCTPTKRSDAQPLVEREKQFEVFLVETSRSEKGKQMLHGL